MTITYDDETYFLTLHINKRDFYRIGSEELLNLPILHKIDLQAYSNFHQYKNLSCISIAFEIKQKEM